MSRITYHHFCQGTHHNLCQGLHITIVVKEHMSQFMSRITYHHFCQGTHVTLYVKDYISPFLSRNTCHNLCKEYLIVYILLLDELEILITWLVWIVDIFLTYIYFTFTLTKMVIYDTWHKLWNVFLDKNGDIRYLT
jgi:hypothetical protein